MLSENESYLSDRADMENECNPFKERVLYHAIQSGLLGEEFPMVGFVDIDSLANTIKNLQEAFPGNFKHAFAAKANTMYSALAQVKQAGMGCEVASPGELEQALSVGFAPGEIIYDEPAKTRAILKKALQLGVGLNIDNFQEYELIREIIAEHPTRSNVGVRLNPQVGVGSIAAMSTATATSKFGIALEDEGNRDRLVEMYKSNEWMTSIHTHVGSQGCALELMLSGIQKVADFAESINDEIGHQQIKIIDIGGGLPVNFWSEDVTPSFADYAKVLEANVPDLFSGKYTVKTEFGRAVMAKNGFIASRVEYVKSSGGRAIVTTHAGAQIAARTVFMPKLWAIRVSAMDSAGQLKRGKVLAQDIAGPCCFAGDLIAHHRELPQLERGDYVLLHDTGAYYFSNPFYYNSLPACAVYGVSEAGTGLKFDLWRKQQTPEEVLAIIG